MNTDQIAYLALLTSVVSLVVSFVTLRRDRHVISVRAVPIELTQGIFHLHISVSNSGRRPISVTHVSLQPPGKDGLSLEFSPQGACRIDVGEVRACSINPMGLPVSWASVAELRTFQIFVLDAVGKKHKAAWQK